MSKKPSRSRSNKKDSAEQQAWKERMKVKFEQKSKQKAAPMEIQKPQYNPYDQYAKEQQELNQKLNSSQKKEKRQSQSSDQDPNNHDVYHTDEEKDSQIQILDAAQIQQQRKELQKIEKQRTQLKRQVQLRRQMALEPKRQKQGYKRSKPYNQDPDDMDVQQEFRQQPRKKPKLQNESKMIAQTNYEQLLEQLDFKLPRESFRAIRDSIKRNKVFWAQIFQSIDESKFQRIFAVLFIKEELTRQQVEAVNDTLEMIYPETQKMFQKGVVTMRQYFYDGSKRLAATKLPMPIQIKGGQVRSGQLFVAQGLKRPVTTGCTQTKDCGSKNFLCKACTSYFLMVFSQELKALSEKKKLTSGAQHWFSDYFKNNGQLKVLMPKSTGTLIKVLVGQNDPRKCQFLFGLISRDKKIAKFEVRQFQYDFYSDSVKTILGAMAFALQVLLNCRMKCGFVAKDAGDFPVESSNQKTDIPTTQLFSFIN